MEVRGGASELYRNETLVRFRAVSQVSSGSLPVAPAALVLFGLVTLCGCHGPPAPATAHVSAVHVDVVGTSIPLGFRETEFGGEGLASIAGNHILLEPGVPLSGVTWTGVPPEAPYVFEVEFTKRYGNDFPCALTFPVAGSHLSLVLGGWGGTVCGLSSLDGLDASRNETRFVRAFPPGVRTHVRVAVSDEVVCAAIDGVEVVRLALAGRTLGVREELLPSRPLGIASFATAVELHSVRWAPADRARVGAIEGAVPRR
jgi:hypothetical protein